MPDAGKQIKTLGATGDGLASLTVCSRRAAAHDAHTLTDGGAIHLQAPLLSAGR